MHYTLDSEKHVISSLQNNYKGHEIVSTPILKNLSELNNKNDKGFFYFGIVTCGRVDPNSDTDNLVFYNEKNEVIIAILPDNQIPLFFHHMVASNPNELGQFRGYEIQVKGL